MSLLHFCIHLARLMLSANFCYLFKQKTLSLSISLVFTPPSLLATDITYFSEVNKGVQKAISV